MVATTGTADEVGFTLVEMLAAIAILSFGMTGLVALLNAGVDTRSGAELRDRAVRAADAVYIEIEHRTLSSLTSQQPGEETAPEELAPVVLDPVPGYPRLKARVAFDEDPDYPDLVLARATITWQNAGFGAGVTFQRILYRGASFPARVASSRKNP